MFTFDEGLLSDDTVLADAVWCNLLEMRALGAGKDTSGDDFGVLGEMCEYIRKNATHLESMSDVDLLRDGIVSFLDFEHVKLDHSKIKPKIFEIIRKKERLEY